MSCPRSLLAKKGDENMKELYAEPELEVIRFEATDIITTSGGLDEDELPPIIVG